MDIKLGRRRVLALLAVVAGGSVFARADGPATNDAELAKELRNPVADLISVPIENRFDLGGGQLQHYNMTFLPVLPFEATSDLLVVSRTVIPAKWERREGGTVTGVGDTLQSFFFAPRKAVDGLIYGAGPVVRLPTASNGLGSNVWGAGPTMVVLKQDEAWTYGFLTNHVWSVAGRNGASMSATFVQPFLAYTTTSVVTFGLGSEAAYDWKSRTWIVPIDLSASRVVRIWESPLNLAFGLRKYLERPAGGPSWGATFTVTLLFPK